MYVSHIVHTYLHGQSFCHTFKIETKVVYYINEQLNKYVGPLEEL